MSPGPLSIPLGLFKIFFGKFAEIFANECLSPVAMTPAISCSPFVNDTGVYSFHGFSVIAGDTGD
jgi:hypothetical protein